MIAEHPRKITSFKGKTCNLFCTLIFVCSTTAVPSYAGYCSDSESLLYCFYGCISIMLRKTHSIIYKNKSEILARNAKWNRQPYNSIELWTHTEQYRRRNNAQKSSWFPEVSILVSGYFSVSAAQLYTWFSRTLQYPKLNLWLCFTLIAHFAICYLKRIGCGMLLSLVPFLS